MSLNSLPPDKFINADAKKISWTRALKQDLAKDKAISFDDSRLVQAVYRPFHKQWMYFSRDINEMIYQMPRIFPDATATNLMIMVKQRWSGEGQLALMLDYPCELQTDGGTQCVPLYLYEPEQAAEAEAPLFAAGKKPGGRKRRDAITDEGLAHFRDAYPGEAISKDDLFYYVYGLLHSPDYRDRFADNLGKELPRIPRVKTAADFWAFSKAGRALGDLHINYEKAPMFGSAKVTHSGNKHDYRVEKMRYGSDKDRTTLIYNDTITVTGIPLEIHAAPRRALAALAARRAAAAGIGLSDRFGVGAGVCRHPLNFDPSP